MELRSTQRLCGTARGAPLPPAGRRGAINFNDGHESPPMAKDPRPPQPGSSNPDEALDLLRALARARQPSQPEQAPPPAAASGEEKIDALRALAEKLDLQLRGAPPAAAPPPGQFSPGPLPPGPSSPLPPPSYPEHLPPPRLPPRSAAEPRSVWNDFQIAWRRAVGLNVRLAFHREWRALAAALPPAGALVPRFGLRQFIFIGISVGVLLIAAIGVVVGPRKPQAPASQPSADVVPPLASAPTAPPGPSVQTFPATPSTDLAAITKAMSDCDAEAIKLPEQLHFLVLPMVPSKGAENDWRTLALQEVGNTFLLLSAKDALDGLRDGKLVVRDGRYTFSVLDSASGQTYSWTSATRIARLSRPAPKEMKALKLGFDFSAAQAGAQWSSEFRRDPGTCYWVSVLVKP